MVRRKSKRGKRRKNRGEKEIQAPENGIPAAVSASSVAASPCIELPGDVTEHILNESPKRHGEMEIQAPENEIAAAVSSSSVAPPPWIELPGDVTANILSRLGADERLVSVQKVCTTWWKACQDPSMWRVIHFPTIYLDEHKDFAIMCRRAVDRSQGQLVDFTIILYVDDELVNYIDDRSPLLKRLTLRTTFGVSGMGLAKAAEKLPELEELHLLEVTYVSAEYVEKVGISCPKLKSFSHNEHGCWDEHRDTVETEEEYDNLMGRYDGRGYAPAVGKSMPNLRHLALIANQMKTDELPMILDGCPNLESLDIRQCFALELGVDMERRCRGQIKDLKLPSDSVSDLEWLDGQDFNDVPLVECRDCDYHYREDYNGYECYGLIGDDDTHGFGFSDDDDDYDYDYNYESDDGFFGDYGHGFSNDGFYYLYL